MPSWKEINSDEHGPVLKEFPRALGNLTLTEGKSTIIKTGQKPDNRGWLMSQSSVGLQSDVIRGATASQDRDMAWAGRIHVHVHSQSQEDRESLKHPLAIPEGPWGPVP